ncbi:hypothetical protein [Neobacillus sp.]|uniref:hypothetical protein n=1 Tax=Neobacillus sp. TaxID=2675273 RepID=UPI00289F681D|nr:hypothetical protein [Neobacillus sp.]
MTRQMLTQCDSAFVFLYECYRKNENALQLLWLQGIFLLIRTKGMGEIFHGQTKGYMFVVINFMNII